MKASRNWQLGRVECEAGVHGKAKRTTSELGMTRMCQTHRSQQNDVLDDRLMMLRELCCMLHEIYVTPKGYLFKDNKLMQFTSQLSQSVSKTDIPNSPIQPYSYQFSMSIHVQDPLLGGVEEFRCKLSYPSSLFWDDLQSNRRLASLNSGWAPFRGHMDHMPEPSKPAGCCCWLTSDSI